MAYDSRYSPGVLVFMDNAAFSRLSELEKAAYLQKAVRAMRSGTRVITPNPLLLKSAALKLTP